MSQKEKEHKRNYAKKYYQENKEKVLARCKKYKDSHQEYNKEYYISNRDKLLQQLREKYKNNRLIVIRHYGGKCAFCGDTNINHLTIDHIDNNGAEHRKIVKTTEITRWLIDNNFPSGFQILCWNHNAEKYFYGAMSLSTKS